MASKINYVILGVVLLLVAGAGSLGLYAVLKGANSGGVHRPTASNVPDWKTYVNEGFGYAIEYPATLEIREFPDFLGGAAFRPIGLVNDLINEVISINASARSSSEEISSLPFEEYVNVAATYEIQGYDSLLRKEKIITKSGIVGYITQWKIYGDPHGRTVSNFIAYFPLDTMYVYPESGITQRYDEVVVFLNDSSYEDIFQTMLKSFQVK